MADSSIAEIISFAEEPGGLQSMELQRVRQDLATQQQLQNLSLSLIYLSICLYSSWVICLFALQYLHSIIVWDFHSIFPHYLTSFNSQRY